MIKTSKLTESKPKLIGLIIAAVLLLTLVFTQVLLTASSVKAKAPECPQPTTFLTVDESGSTFCTDGGGNVCRINSLGYDEMGGAFCPTSPTSPKTPTADSTGLFDPTYVGYDAGKCQALGDTGLTPEFVETNPDDATYLQREADRNVAVCMSTINTNIGSCAVGDSGADCVKTVPIFERLLQIMNLLAAGVGLFVTALIVFRGLQYASARNNPQQVAEAKNGILQALIALFVYIFMYAFLQWIVPGGIF